MFSNEIKLFGAGKLNYDFIFVENFLIGSSEVTKLRSILCNEKLSNKCTHSKVSEKMSMRDFFIQLFLRHSDLHAGLECIRSYTRRCMNPQEREHFNKLYFGTNEMIKDLCSEGSYQEGTCVCFNLIKFQNSIWLMIFLWLLLDIVSQLLPLSFF